MKIFVTVLFLHFLPLVFLAQSSKKLTIEDSIKIESKVQVQAEALWKRLSEHNSHPSDYLSSLENKFVVDTFKIESRMNWQIEQDYSTAGMLRATYRATAEYDKLLNKYYQSILTQLDEKDRVILKQAQRSWIVFRNSERELNNLLAVEKYSGGGTIQSLFVAFRSFEVTRQRVFDLHNYLMRFVVD